MMMLMFFIVLNGTSLPYNTTLPSNPAYFTKIITQNFPWFFPIIILFSFLWVDYLLSKFEETRGTKSMVISSVAYTFFCYMLVAGGLTTSGMFYLFSTIGIIALFFDTLITSGFP
jgi:hypothetical protein